MITIEFTQDEMSVAKAIHAAGGQICAIGGGVRDAVIAKITGVPVSSKDMDVEVTGMTVADIIATVTPHCKSIDTVGAKFGVIAVRFESGETMDITIARRENKTGEGKKGFIVEFDPSITPIEAASRRDFTWNAMSVNMVTGEFNDFFNGVEDIKNRIIRHIEWNGKTAFTEDTTRVMRGMQFSARFNMRPHRQTVIVCHQAISEFHTIASEMIWKEFEKAFGKGVKPSNAIKFINVCQWGEKFPEFAHVGHFQMERMDEISTICEKSDKVVFVIASMFVEAGEAIAESFMKRVNAPVQVRKAVVEVVRRSHGRVETAKGIIRMGKMVRIIEGRHVMPFGFEGAEIGKVVQSAWVAQMDGEFNSVEDGIKWVKDNFSKGE